MKINKKHKIKAKDIMRMHAHEIKKLFVCGSDNFIIEKKKFRGLKNTIKKDLRVRSKAYIGLFISTFLLGGYIGYLLYLGNNTYTSVKGWILFVIFLVLLLFRDSNNRRLRM